MRIACSRFSVSTIFGLILGLFLTPLFYSHPTPRVEAIAEPVAKPDPYGLEVQSSDYERAFELVKQSVYKISGPEGHGSAFVLYPGYLLTNEHVVRENAHGHKAEPFVLPLPFTLPFLLPKIELREKHYEARCFTGSDEVEGKKFAVAPVVLADGTRATWKDMALLRMPPDAQCAGRAFPIGTAKVGMPVMVVGSPAEEDNATFGRVSKIKGVPKEEKNKLWQDVPMIGVDAGINFGNSGGPTFGLRKEIVAGKPELKVELIAMSTYRWSASDNLAGGISADYIAYIATTKWGLPMLTADQVDAYRKAHPLAR